jgi:hypothetical protein
MLKLKLQAAQAPQIIQTDFWLQVDKPVTTSSLVLGLLLTETGEAVPCA